MVLCVLWALRAICVKGANSAEDDKDDKGSTAAKGAKSARNVEHLDKGYYLPNGDNGAKEYTRAMGAKGDKGIQSGRRRC